MAISTETVRSRDVETGHGWIRSYLRDHAIHIVVIAFFALYPGVHSAFVGQYDPFGDNLSFLMVLFPTPRVMGELMYLALFAISFDFISGYTGYLSFGHSMFFGSGMFFVLGARSGMLPVFGPESSFMLLVVAAMVVTFAITFLIGLVSFRLTGVYFAMITLGFAEIAKLLMIEVFGTESALTPDAGSYAVGVPFIDSLKLPLRGSGEAVLSLNAVPGLDIVISILSSIPVVANYIGDTVAFNGVETAYYMLGIITLLGYFAMQRIIHSPFGRVMIAIRENEDRAEAIGYNTYWYKMIAFSLSGAFAAVAGAMAAGLHNAGQATRHFDVIHMSGDALLATIIGGMGTLAGPFYGFIFDRNLAEMLGGNPNVVVYLEETFPDLVTSGIGFGVTVQDFLNNSVQGFSGFYVGIIFILFILYVPGGLLGTARSAMGGKLSESFPPWLSRRWKGLKNAVGRFQ
ncbi:branched-chain amino acid ABC transporter permease [Halobacteriales archaeon Cl-PHB]